VTYDMGAICPNIETHFNTVLSSEEDKELLYEWYGYTLYKRQLIAKSLMLTGKGRNGKSVTISIWKAFLGKENTISLSLQEVNESQFIGSELLHKMCNLAGEIPPVPLKTTKRFKDITGGDRITVDVKFKPRLSFEPYIKMVFSANEIPISYDDTDAFWNRWSIIEFPFKFVSQKELDSMEDISKVKLADPTIIGKLTSDEELSGLLNKALDGLAMLIRKGDFSGNRTSEDVKDFWIRKSDSLKAFIKDCCKLNYDSYVTKTDFRSVYSEYCNDRKIRVMSDKHIRYVLAVMGVSEDRELHLINGERKQIYIWKGIEVATLVKVATHSKSPTEERPSLGDSNQVANLTTLANYNKSNTENETISDDPDNYPDEFRPIDRGEDYDG
jgi:P4 family phage/plasmid primase-like protien